MWFPWFKKFREESRKSQEELRREIVSIRNADEAREKRENELGFSIVAAINRVGDATPDHESPQREKEYRLQRAVFLATVAGVVFAALAAGGAWYYAYIAEGQLRTMAETYGEIQQQTPLLKQSADAAQSAATTANEALHVTERAYLVAGGGNVNFVEKSVTVPLVNLGHIPSGEATVVVHQATYDLPGVMADLSESMPQNRPIQTAWQRMRFQSIVPGGGQGVAIPAPALNADLANRGLQTVIVAGTIRYNDGFPDDPPAAWKFCVRSFYQITMKKQYVISCDPERAIPQLERNDGYPNHENPH